MSTHAPIHALRRTASWSRGNTQQFFQAFGRKTAHNAPDFVWGDGPAYAHALNTLNRLARQLRDTDAALPTSDARDVLTAILRSCLARDSVFPTVADDGEGGLVADWRADDRRISIVVDSDGESLISVHGSAGQLIYRGDASTQLRRHLRDLTAYVNNSNPGWRSLFKTGHE